MPNTLGATPGIVAVGLAWGCVGALAAPDNRFAEFLAANPPLEDTVCAYTTTATSSEYPGETRVERFSPGNGWQLLTVNGEPPSARALKDYAKDADDRAASGSSPRISTSLAWCGQKPPTSSKKTPSIVFAFTPDSPDAGRGRAMMEKMSGRLTVAKDGLRPLTYVVELDGPTSPMPGMKFEAFRQEMAFAIEPTSGASLMTSFDFAMRGKAFVFRKMDGEAHIEASDYDSPNRQEPSAGERGACPSQGRAFSRGARGACPSQRKRSSP